MCSVLTFPAPKPSSSIPESQQDVSLRMGKASGDHLWGGIVCKLLLARYEKLHYNKVELARCRRIQIFHQLFSALANESIASPGPSQVLDERAF